MSIYLLALAAILLVGALAWVVSVLLDDVSFVDSLWSLFFLLAAIVFALNAELLSARALLVLSLVAVWAVRLSLHITIRNWGEPEDYRYQAIRANNEPGFVVKSLLYRVRPAGRSRLDRRCSPVACDSFVGSSRGARCGGGIAVLYRLRV